MQQLGISFWTMPFIVQKLPLLSSWTHGAALLQLLVLLLATDHYVKGSDQSGQWQCPVQDPYQVISEADRFVCCNMYMDWMKKSKEKFSFYPTPKIQRWFQHLGMKQHRQTVQQPKRARYARQAPRRIFPPLPFSLPPPPPNFLQNIRSRITQGQDGIGNRISRFPGGDNTDTVNRASSNARANAFLLQRGANNVADPVRLHYREEYRSLTKEKRDRFHRALNRLKNSFVDGVREYDIFVGYHRANLSPGAHFGPAFLPFHRELLFRLERALQRFDPDVALPYWNSTMDEGLENAEDSIMWTEEFAGNGYGNVTTGPFANWPTRFATEGINVLFRNLTYGFEQRPFPGLMADDGIPDSATRFRDITFYVDSTFELNHGKTHNWVGGQMIDLENSPGDPVFFLHHAFIDCAWEEFRERQKANGIDPRFDYPNDTVALGVNQTPPPGVAQITSLETSYQRFEDRMLPFEITNGDGLANEYTEHFYKCSSSSNDCPCTSPYLFCDSSSGPSTCRPRLRVGAKCTRYMMMDACYNSMCCYIDGSSSEAVCRSFCPPYARPTETPGPISTTAQAEITTDPPITITGTPPNTASTSRQPPTSQRTTGVIFRPPRPRARGQQTNSNRERPAPQPVTTTSPSGDKSDNRPFVFPNFIRNVNNFFSPIRIRPGNLFTQGSFLPLPFRPGFPSFIAGGQDAASDEDSVRQRRQLQNRE
ncbi:uncharacterized protein LOC106153243 [Lingula anatina]|uniref:Uncharacterized protein LOC106153243 n=1 Tax=Lingula anatina TaxID=7574 RepID=A0A1S3H960_LINAN|nr:uncharacterized protein LOC106153243 [Lingula anatina]|eukprot:XP_013382548.1 uncharacterized protein LOC106153243 [Lingula anatina]